MKNCLPILFPRALGFGCGGLQDRHSRNRRASKLISQSRTTFVFFWFCFSALISWYGIRFVQNRSSDQSFENHRTRLTRHSKVISIVNILWVHYYFEEKYVIRYNIEIITSLSFLDSIYYYFVSGFPAYTIVSSTAISHFVFKRMRYTFIFEAVFFLILAE